MVTEVDARGHTMTKAALALSASRLSEFQVFVCRKNRVRDTAKKLGVTHILSILDPCDRLVTPSCVRPANHLTLNMDDTHEPGDAYPPTLAHVERVHVWARSLPGDARLLVHCFQGVSRSTAMTLGLLAARMPVADAAERLRAIRPEATPNRLLVSLWDQYLDLGGALIAAAEGFPPPLWSLPLHLRAAGSR
jgi:predicted protein tyrosine phosphatase